MSALEEHNNSLLHKEALRLQMASKDKIVVDKTIYVKGWLLIHDFLLSGVDFKILTSGFVGCIYIYILNHSCDCIILS
jgi:hypothetical protein